MTPPRLRSLSSAVLPTTRNKHRLTRRPRPAPNDRWDGIEISTIHHPAVGVASKVSHRCDSWGRCRQGRAMGVFRTGAGETHSPEKGSALSSGTSSQGSACPRRRTRVFGRLALATAKRAPVCED